MIILDKELWGFIPLFILNSLFKNLFRSPREYGAISIQELAEKYEPQTIRLVLGSSLNNHENNIYYIPRNVNRMMGMRLG